MAASVYGKGRRLTSIISGGKTSVVGRQKPDIFLEQRSQPPMVAANDDGPAWGAICLNPNCEVRVERRLEQLGITMYRPTYTDWRALPNDSGRQEVERNLMPPYAFIHFGDGGQNWFGLSQIDGIRGIVAGNNRVPITIPAHMIAKIASEQRNGAHDKVKRRVSKAGNVSAMPEISFGLKDKVRISYGPFGGHEATVESVEALSTGYVEAAMQFLGTFRVVKVPVESLEAVG